MTRRSPAIDCDILELMMVCFDLLVREKSAGVGIAMVYKIVLQNRLLVDKRSTDAKIQFAMLNQPSRTTCSQPLSLHDRGDHLCRDGGAKGRYFESADRGEGLTQAPTFGACSSARLAVLRLELARSTPCMTRRASQVWPGSADTCARDYIHVTQFGDLQENRTRCRTPQTIFSTACSTRRALV
jgi:hypothetical protein